MNINVICPGCGKSSEVDPKLIGSMMKCPGCGKDFEITNPNLIVIGFYLIVPKK